MASLSSPFSLSNYRLRFSLAGFMVAITAVCIMLGMKAREVRIQRNAVAAIQLAGGTVAYDDQYDSNIILTPNVLACGFIPSKRDSLIPAFLDEYLGRDFFADVVMVNLQDTEVDDELLKELVGLAKINTLHLSRSEISDECLRSVNQLKYLKILTLQGTAITNQGLADLQDLERLEYLSLGGTRITDDGLANLERFPELRVLQLDNTISMHNGIHKKTRPTSVTNLGLSHLNRLPKLEYLSVAGTDINSEGESLLRESLPRLRVVH